MVQWNTKPKEWQAPTDSTLQETGSTKPAARSGERLSRLETTGTSIGSYNFNIIESTLHENALDRLFPFGSRVAHAPRHHSGHAIDLVEALIAGMAWANALTVAIRNVAEFRPFNVEAFSSRTSP